MTEFIAAFFNVFSFLQGSVPSEQVMFFENMITMFNMGWVFEIPVVADVFSQILGFLVH